VLLAVHDVDARPGDGGAVRRDEQAHWHLIEVLRECGRHGVARRAHTRYSHAMSEIYAVMSAPT
jgi:hypothetical protein